MADLEGFGLSGILAIVVTVLLVAALLPAAVNSATGANFSDRQSTVTLNVGESYNLSDTNATVMLDSANSTNATYTFVADGDSETVTVDENANSSVTVNSVTYNVTVTDASSSQQTATAEIAYQVNSGGLAQEVWILVPLFIVLAPLLILVGFATSKADQI